MSSCAARSSPVATASGIGIAVRSLVAPGTLSTMTTESGARHRISGSRYAATSTATPTGRQRPGSSRPVG